MSDLPARTHPTHLMQRLMSLEGRVIALENAFKNVKKRELAQSLIADEQQAAAEAENDEAETDQPEE